jgi:hypothetical protein
VSEQYSAPPPQSSPATPLAGQPASASSPPAQSLSTEQQPGLQAGAAAIAEEKPEIAAGAAFAAGFLFAMILRRLAR